MLAFLLVNRQRPHPREVLIEHIWGEYTKDQAQRGLRQALWQLQSALNEHEPHVTPSLLEADAAWVQINPQSSYWLDIAVLEESYSRVQGVPGARLGPEEAQLLTSAVALYQGDLLENCYQDWCLIERERLKNMYLTLLDKLLDYNQVQGRYETAIDYGERILRHDCAREQTHCKLMYLHCLAGNRTGALRQYEACVAALEKELAVAPARQTQALYQSIKTDHVVAPPRPDVPPPPALGTPSSLPGLLEHLQQLSVALADLERFVAQDILLVEALLRAAK